MGIGKVPATYWMGRGNSLLDRLSSKSTHVEEDGADIPLTLYREVAAAPNPYRDLEPDRERDRRRAVVPAKRGRDDVDSLTLLYPGKDASGEGVVKKKRRSEKSRRRKGHPGGGGGGGGRQNEKASC